MGLLLAAVAAAWHVVLMTATTNDNFLHLALAQQWLAGDWPVRDFYEGGWVLQYALSAGAQLLFGERLLSESVIVGCSWAISTYLVFHVVHRITLSPGAAALAALLLIIAGPRGYSYPKGIVYAVAAVLWWRYARVPTTPRLVALGVWTAVAFYWRPDHGVYVAAAVALVAVATHGLRAVTWRQCAAAGATTIGLLTPFMGYVHWTVGLPEYVETGLVQARVEHASHGTHEWPLLRMAGELVAVDPADTYAPEVTLRWSGDSTAAHRREVLSRYELREVEGDGNNTRVRLAESSLDRLRLLINEPIVEDTAGIDRSTSTLADGSWTWIDRYRFRYAWLRLRLLPLLDGEARASEFAAALFFLMPIVLVLAARWMPDRLAGDATAIHLAAFAVFALLVDYAMLRRPLTARMPDAVTLSAIVFGVLIGWLWTLARGGVLRAVVAGPLAIMLATAVTLSVGGAARVVDRLAWLTGDWGSLRRARGAWEEVYGQLGSSPPLVFYQDRRASEELRLAAYVRDCVPASDRLLVLWFAPDIHYYSSRLMAQRHLVFAPAWAEVAHEQRLTLDKIERYAPPLVLARQSALDEYARATFPGVIDYVEREYRTAAKLIEGNEEYLILARRDRRPVRSYESGGWPCFVREPSAWASVGRPPA